MKAMWLRKRRPNRPRPLSRQRQRRSKSRKRRRLCLNHSHSQRRSKLPPRRLLRPLSLNLNLSPFRRVSLNRNLRQRPLRRRLLHPQHPRLRRRHPRQSPPQSRASPPA